MHSIFIGIGNVKQYLSKDKVLDWCNISEEMSLEVLNLKENLFLALTSPEKKEKSDSIIWSDDRKFVVVIDGYLLVKSDGGGKSQYHHLKFLVNNISTQGFSRGLQSIESGSFNGIVVDVKNDKYYIINDSFGSIPLYYGKSENGYLFSTNPVALLLSGLFSREVDYTACAELALIGYTLGNRHFLKDLKVFPQGSMFCWTENERNSEITKTSLSFSLTPNGKGFKEDLTDRIAESMRLACTRISSLPDKFAHLQSSGLDSRLILAAWPDNHPLPCYTYGKSNSFEVMVAKTIAETKGSEFHYYRPTGDEVAENLDVMFRNCGLMVYPDRFAVAKKIKQDGHNAILDGFLGGVFLGGYYYTMDKYFFPGNLLRQLLIFKDKKISKIGLEGLTDILFNEIYKKDSRFLLDYLEEDIASKLMNEKENIKDDIFQQLSQFCPSNDSVAILFRNFKLANRAIHAIAMQGVMSRQFVQVYTPFTNDTSFSSQVFQLEPGEVAYKKFYIKLFRKHFSKFSDLLYGSSGLPVRRSPMSHRWSSRLKSRGYNFPYITGKDYGLSANPNNWDSWLKESPLLRNKTVNFFSENGVGNKEKIAKNMEKIASDEQSGSGRIFHLASIVKWL